MDKNTENLIDKKIDELALAMHKGFEAVDKRFEGVEGEITSIKKELKEVRRDMDKRFEEVERKSQKRRNELMNSNDKMIKILQDNRQELASQRFISEKQQEKLEDHEKRIKFLELHKTA